MIVVLGSEFAERALIVYGFSGNPLGYSELFMGEVLENLRSICGVVCFYVSNCCVGFERVADKFRVPQTRSRWYCLSQSGNDLKKTVC